MRSYYLHRKLTTAERTDENKTCPECRKSTQMGFRGWVGHPSCDEDLGWPDEELGFSASDDLGTCSPEMIVLCAMIDEIMEVLGHSARNLDDTLAQYVLDQYQTELKKTQDGLLEEKEDTK